MKPKVVAILHTVLNLGSHGELQTTVVEPHPDETVFNFAERCLTNVTGQMADSGKVTQREVQIFDYVELKLTRLNKNNQLYNCDDTESKKEHDDAEAVRNYDEASDLVGYIYNQLNDGKQLHTITNDVAGKFTVHKQ